MSHELPYITIGDPFTLSCTATTNGTTAWDLTGATFETKMLNADGTELTIDTDAHAILVAASGTFTIAGTAVQSALLKADPDATFKTEITQSGETKTLWFDKALNIRKASIAEQ